MKKEINMQQGKTKNAHRHCELTNEVGAEAKLVLTMTCKEEENHSKRSEAIQTPLSNNPFPISLSCGEGVRRTGEAGEGLGVRPENEKEMLTDKVRDSIVRRAERLIHYNELLIKQCDSWLSAEEGNRNMMKRIEERRRAEKRMKQNEKWRRWKQAIARLFHLTPDPSRPPSPSGLPPQGEEKRKGFFERGAANPKDLI